MFQSLSTFISSHFFNPAFVVPGVALVSSPIIIHLINRMRFRRVRFAAMEFLLQSQKRNRRRLLIEQLLLLLLRILIVLGLTALIARLILDESQLSMFRAAKTHHFVLLDDSGSMRDRWGETTAFDEALSVVRRLAAEAARRPQTTFTVIRLSSPASEFVPQTTAGEELLRQLENRLDTLKDNCTRRQLDLPAGLEAIRQRLGEEKSGILNLHIVTDSRTRDWTDQPAAATALEAIDEAGVDINFIRCVPEQHPNLAVSRLEGDLQIAAAGIPLRLTVAVQNLGETVARDVRVSVFTDGNRLPRNLVFNQIESGDEVEREFDVLFESAGRHTVRVALEADSLAADNERFAAINVPQSNAVLIVAGEPDGDGAFYLESALAPAAGTTGFAPLVESVDYLRRHPLHQFESIFLVDVPGLPDDAIEPLKQYVAGGGGLIWYLGNSVQPANYNRSLYSAEETGLFPVPLALSRRELPRDDGTSPGPDLVFEKHPVFERTFEAENPFSAVVNVFSWLPVAEGWERNDNVRRDGVTTIATLRNRQPVVFEHGYGEGRVVTFLTSAGSEWNNWASGSGAPSFVTTLLELEKYISRDDDRGATRLVGQPIDLRWERTEFTEDVTVLTPADQSFQIKGAPPRKAGGNGPAVGSTEADDDGAAGTPGDEAASEEAATPDDADASVLLSSFTATDLPGVYVVRQIDLEDSVHENWLAYNVALEESQLTLASQEDLRRRFGETDVRIYDADNFDEVVQEKGAGQELRRALLIALVLILLAEQLLAHRLSFHHNMAGAAA